MFHVLNVKLPRQYGIVLTDPASLQALARTTQCHNPSPYQRSPLSDLQKFVKEARQTIVDPVLSHFAILLESDPGDHELESDLSVSKPRVSTEELKRERERQKLDNSVVQNLSSSLTPMELDLSTPSSGSGTLSQGVSPPLRHTSRVRRPSAKLQATQAANGTFTANSTTAGLLPRRGTTTKRMCNPSTEIEPEPEPMLPTAKRMHNPDKVQASGKPKSETYKQAWSVSEQHLLEQLLEQIPDGAKNRWVPSLMGEIVIVLLTWKLEDGKKSHEQWMGRERRDRWRVASKSILRN